MEFIEDCTNQVGRDGIEINRLPRILIIDDNETLSRSLQLILDKQGYSSAISLTGIDALAKSKEVKFDLALVDLKLPDMDGTQLISALMRIITDIDCIVITGNASIDTAIRALEHEVSGYLTKPLDIERMLQLIAQIIQKKKLIDEKEKSLLALEKSEQRNRVIIGAMSDLILVYNEENNLIEYIAADESLLCRPWDDMKGKKFEEYMPDDVIAKHYDSLERVRKYGKLRSYDYELEIDGKIKSFLATVMLHDDKKSVVIAVKEITEQRKMEESLRESKKWFRLIIKDSPIAINIFDCDGNLITANDAMLDFMGIAKVEELSNLNLLENPNLPPEIRNLILRGESTIWEHEIDFDILCDKEIFPTSKKGIAYVKSGISSLRKESNGKVLGYIVQVIDETIKIKAEKVIVEERDRTQGYLDIAGAAIVVLDTKGDVVLINRKGSEILGKPINEIIGMNWFENFIPHHLREEVNEIFSNIMRGEIENNEEVESAIVTSTGEERNIEWRNSIVYDSNENIIGSMSSGVDFTDRRIARENLKSSAETATLYLDIMGHDIRNHLQAILMASDIISHYELGAEIEPIFEIITESIAKSQKLIEQVQATRELLTIPLEKVSLLEVITECVEISKEIYDDIEIEMISEIAEAKIKADIYLRLVLGNLVNNAVVHNVSDTKHVWIDLKATHDGYIVTIKDDGPGISDLRKESLFEAKRRFGGVGLHQAKSIVQKYGGYISIEDRVPGESDQGAAFTIWLPKAESNQIEDKSSN